MRILFLILFFYFILQVLRMLFRSRVIIRNFNYTDNRGSGQNKRHEGEVKISGQTEKPGKSGKNPQIGEYVDYEEVK